MIAPLAAIVLALQSPLILDRAHSHNDYNRTRPLFDALENRFASIEIDVFLVDGKLLVAHDRSQLATAKTIEELYFNPLQKMRDANSGMIYRGLKDRLWILIDIKSDGARAYQSLKRSLDANYLSRIFIRNVSIPDFVGPTCRFVVSGDRPINAIVADNGIEVGFDGRWADLGKNYLPRVMPLISESWTSHFTWLGNGVFPIEQADKLKSMVKRVHSERRRIRFWGAPDIPAIWEVQWKAGVDLIGTDRPAELRKWMLAQKG